MRNAGAYLIRSHTYQMGQSMPGFRTPFMKIMFSAFYMEPALFSTFEILLEFNTIVFRIII